jgi:hypothetical protein
MMRSNEPRIKWLPMRKRGDKQLKLQLPKRKVAKVLRKSNRKRMMMRRKKRSHSQ